MEGSITSDFPSLLALNSMRAGKYEGVATPPELADKPKYLPTQQYKNGTVVSLLPECGRSGALTPLVALQCKTDCSEIVRANMPGYINMLHGDLVLTGLFCTMYV
jgi:hypothetical protein